MHDKDKPAACTQICEKGTQPHSDAFVLCCRTVVWLQLQSMCHRCKRMALRQCWCTAALEALLAKVMCSSFENERCKRCARCMLQVSLLACGRLMYHGGRAGIAPWFASLGYERQHGDESDWLLDLVATGFDKPRQLYGNALMQEQDIKPAAEAFTASYVQVTGCRQPSVAPHECQQGLSDTNHQCHTTLACCTCFL